MARRRSTEAAERSVRQLSSVASETPGLWVESQARVFEHFDEVARDGSIVVERLLMPHAGHSRK